MPNVFHKRFFAFILVCCFILNGSFLYGQIQGTGMFFQAIARDNSSNPAKDRKIFIESSIKQFTASGNVYLSEIHEANTDASGVFSISIGQGAKNGGIVNSLSSIPWDNGPFYLSLKIAISPTAPINNWDYTKEWIDLGTTPFGIVPYALYAGNVDGMDKKVNFTDSNRIYVTPYQLKLKTFDTVSISNRINNKLDLSDTTNLLSPYFRTAYLNDFLINKINYSDTNIMLSNRIARDTFSLSNRINLKLNISDTSNLLSPYFRTAYLNNFLINKVNYSDTNIMLSNRIARDTISLSNRINLKEDANNKSNNISLDGLLDTKYPSVKAVKDYVDSNIAKIDYLSPTGSAINLTNFPVLNQNTTGSATSLSNAYINWNANSGGSSIINKPILFSGSYNDLTSKPNLFSGSYYDLINKPILFSGTYADLTGVPNLFSGSYNDLTSKPLLFSGAYADLTGVPNLFSGSYNDLSSKPLLFTGSYNDLTSKPNLFSGSYYDLINKPILFSGAYADLTGTPILFSGSYNDLSNKPILFSGAYSDLTGKPNLFSGSYNDLTSKPLLFSGAYADLTGVPNLFSGSYNDLTSKPNLFSGAYADLTGKPTLTNGTVTTVNALAINNSGTDISSSVSNSTSTPTITLNIPTASGTNRGVLSVADWLAFNAKGDMTLSAVQTVVGAKTFSSTIIGSISGNAATATKLATPVTINGTSFDGSANISFSTNTVNALSFNNIGTGDVSGTSFNGSAVKTISYNTIGAAPTIGSTSITTLGNISTGTWNATSISVAKGGTGATTLTANAVILGNGTSAVTSVSPSSNGNVLTSNGTTWISSTPSITLIRDIADEFIATAAQTLFTLSQTPSVNSKVKMYINGVRISNAAYSFSGTTLTYNATNNGAYSLTANDRIQFDYYY